MNTEEIKSLIETAIPGSTAHIHAEGSHVSATVISDAFDGLNAVKKQQLVYSGLNEAIASGAIHAVNIKAMTPSEWANR